MNPFRSLRDYELYLASTHPHHNRPDYDPYSSYPDTRSDDNSDDDDRSSGSIWDGWLVKW